MPQQPIAELPLLALLASKEEDRFTEFLAALLRTRGVGAAFLREFCDVRDAGEWLDVQTQFVVDDGRPDLVIRGATFLVVIEVKLESALRRGQLRPYDAYLEKEAEPRKVLAVLVARRDAEAARAVAADDLDGVPVMLTWESVGEFCGARADALSRDDAARTWLEGFARLIAFRLGQEAREMTKTEIDGLQTRGVAQGLRNALSLLGPIKSALVDEGFALTASATFGYEGYTVRYKKRWWWFGLWITAWAGTGKGPLLLQLPGVPSTRPAPRLAGAGVPVKNDADESHCWVVPLDLEAEEGPSDAAQRIAKIIVRWVKESPATGGG